MIVVDKPKRHLPAMVLEERTFLVRGLQSGWFMGVLFLAMLGLGLAYQMPLDWGYRLGPAFPADHLYIQSFNPAESNANLSFRWSSQESYLRFPGAGRVSTAHLEIHMQPGGRTPEIGLPRVQVWDDKKLLGEVEVRPDIPVYSFDYRSEGRNLAGNLVFTLKILNAFKDSGHNLLLGVVVSEVRLTTGPPDGRLVIPALNHYAFLLANFVIIYLLLVRAGWQNWQAAGLTSSLIIVTSFVIAFYRFHLTPIIETLLLISLLAYPLLILGLRTVGFWLKRRGQILLPTQARWLGLIFVATFIVKLVGLSHPAFQTIDHWFRIHQINRFWDYPAQFWQQYYNVSTGTTVTGQVGGSAVLGQWDVQVSLPYSPLFYLFAAPLNLIWPEHNDPNLLVAVNSLVTWLEASQIFLLYLICRLAYPLAGRAGLLAGAIFGFYPLSFLLFSDGGYNSVFAAWLSLLFLTLTVDWLKQAVKNRWLELAIIITFAAALLAHTSTLLLLSAFASVGFLLLYFSKDYKAKSWQFARLSLFGLALATLLYYGWYVPELVTKTLPTLLARLGGTGAIGQDNNLLGTKLLSGFWPQLWEHYRVIPLILALALFFLLGKNKFDFVPRLLLAGLVIFGLFSVVDLKVNLLQKHMLFAAPFLCLGSGLALNMLWDKYGDKRNWQSWLIIGLATSFLLFNLSQGLLIWYARVYYLIYQPGAG